MERMSPASRLSSEMGTEGFHFDAEVLAQLLRGGFEGPTDRPEVRAEVLYHLSDRCKPCLAALDEAARRLAEDGVAAWNRRDRDPVILALRHRVELLWNRPGSSEAVLWMRSAHRYWLERISDEPLAFSRVVLEESRQPGPDVHQYPDLVEPHSDEILSGVSDQRRRRLHPQRWHDLRALAEVYLADDLQVQGRLGEAKLGFRRARLELSRGTGDAEVRATLRELEADLAVKEGLGSRALKLVKDAAALLDGSPIPGRRAETLVRHGMIRIELQDFLGSVPFFEQALADEDVDRPSRLRAFHYLAFAKVQTRAFGEALETLAEAEPLYSERAPERLRLERLVMEGVSLLESGQRELAEQPLRQAVDALYRRGLWLDAAKVLADLARLYFLEERAEDAAKLGQEYSKLLASKAVDELSRTELQKLRKIALKAGLRIPKMGPDSKWLH